MSSVTHLSQAARSKGDPKILKTGPSSLDSGDQLARGLGWFSIALGLAEALAPRVLTGALGMEGRETLVRAYGLRELGAGMMTLSTEREFGLQSRVLGDALDIATLLAASRNNGKRGNVAAALVMVAGVTLLDIIAAKGVADRRRRPSRPPRSYRNRSGFPGGVDKARGAARTATGGNFDPKPSPKSTSGIASSA